MSLDDLMELKAHNAEDTSYLEARDAEKIRWYFTFGCGSPLAKCYVVVEADEQQLAREIIFSLFSGHWSSCYSEADFQGQPERWGLRELDVNFEADLRLGTNRDELPQEIYTRVCEWLDARRG